MKENTAKSIISALFGAVVVLLVALMVLTFTQKDEAVESAVVKKPSVEVKKPVQEQRKSLEVTRVKKAVDVEVKDAFDSFGVLDRPKVIPVDKVVKKRIPPKNKTDESKQAPLVKIVENKELAELNSIIADQKEKIKVNEKKTINDLFEESPKKPEEPKKTPIARKEVIPEDKSPVRTDSHMEVKSELESFVFGENPFLSTTANDFNDKWLSKLSSVWTDNIHSSARSNDSLRFGDFSSLETVFSFRESKLKKITMMVYNKGDVGRITKGSFSKVRNDVLQKMVALLGERPLFKPNAGITRNNIYFWVINNILYKLEYSATETSKEFLSEYIRVVVMKSRPGINVINIDKTDTNVLTEEDLRGLVTRETNGDVMINGIPMVDQGKKGYCACAALARLMIYFGRDFDQHDIAKLAASTGSEGSDPKSLKKAIETMSAMLRLNMKVLAKCYMSDVTDNKTKRKLVDMKERQSLLDTNSKVFKSMAYNNRRYREFEKNVMSSIDRGRPVAWALEVGMIPEKGIPQSSGGHMRIITGYNKSEGVIYYTDTWGAGHEKKKMDMNSAFFVSYAVWEISPR